MEINELDKEVNGIDRIKYGLKKRRQELILKFGGKIICFL